MREARVLDHYTQLRLIQADREREFEALQRARLVRPGPPRPPRNPIRRSLGRVLLRAGMWLIISATPGSLQR